jgi:hypothetical protein
VTTVQSNSISGDALKAGESVRKAIEGTLGRIGGSALFTWLAGVGLHSGYGVSVPFLGTWVAAVGGLIVIGHVIGAAAGSFHASKINAAGPLKAAEHLASAELLAALSKRPGSAGS